ncbi:MAG: HlyD family efflux transporter periplasmic adaptor subunit [Acidobacteriia bacterium]|nr:HlyD family efflux transporter periplasmic adaptor subunit [Terriglobia bacterium]
MDIKREGVAKRKRIRFIAYGILTLGALGAAGWRVSKLEPAAPTVERATVWIDSVKRGPIVIERKGLGKLAPEEIIVIPSLQDGQVIKVPIKSGQKVTPDTVLMVLTNPDMDLAANDLEWQVKQAQATYADLKVKLQSQRFDQQSAVATAENALKQASLNKDKDEQLFKFQIQTDLNVKLSTANWEQANSRFQTEKQKLDIMKDSIDAQLESAKVQIDKLQAAWERKKQQLKDLTVRAGTDGVVQELTLQVGTHVSAGTVVAKVAQAKLQAELQIAETQAKDILLGQKASIDTRNGIIPAHVVRIDPNVINGTRTVDCKLDGPLPSGAVPDLSVDGTVEIERLADVVYIGRPVFGQPDSSVSLFKLEPDGKGASRVTVKLGRSSVNTIEVVDGLKVGDQVILSDMSAQDQNPRIRLD